jgi:hypothetical protein
VFFVVRQEVLLVLLVQVLLVLLVQVEQKEQKEPPEMFVVVRLLAAVAE